MTLRNKDGSVFRLSLAKPPAITQELWEQEQANYVLHNWEWPDTQSVAEAPPEPPVMEEPPPPTSTPVVEDPPPTVVETLPPTPHKLQIPDAIRNKIVMFFCLPVGGNQFTFEGLVVDNSDLDMTIWTNLPSLVKGSIIFPSKYVNVEEEYDDYRWWKVQGCTAKSSGVLAYCLPSEVTPDFT